MKTLKTVKTNYFNPEKRNKPVYGDFIIREEYENYKVSVEFNFEVLRTFSEFRNKSDEKLRAVCKIAAKAIVTFSESET